MAALFRKSINAISLFGGVQMVTVIVGIVREKLIALLIGPIGIGLNGLLISFIGLITSISGLGINTSAVKYISQENNPTNIILITRKLVLVTSIIALIVTIAFSESISFLIFNDNSNEKTIYTILIAFSIFFFGLENGELAILQARKELKKLAKARVFASIFGLTLSIPLYFYLELKGIVISLVLIYLINILTISYYSNYFKELILAGDKFISLIRKGNKLIQLGVFITLSAIIMNMVNFITKQFVISYGSIQDLGLYESGFKLINGYGGMIFVVMAKDYFPRLADVVTNHQERRKLVSIQILSALFFLIPVSIALVLFAEEILTILYSKEFASVKNFIYIAVPGLIFKLISWALSYVFIADGKNKIFISYEILGGSFLLIFNLYAYSKMGINGLALSYLLYQILYFLVLTILALRIYSFKLNSEIQLIVTIGLIMLGILISLKIYSNIHMSFKILVLLVSFLISAVLIRQKYLKEK